MLFLQQVVTSAILSLKLISVYVLFGVGIVVIYRASRVINLAHGALAVVPAYIFYSLGRHGMSLPLACAVGVLGGAVMGALVEILVVRRLRRQGPVAQTVGTVAVYGLVVALCTKFYGSLPLLPPHLLPTGTVTVGTGVLQVSTFPVFAIGVGATLACLALFRFTDIGLAMRGAADNRRAASLMGVNPDRTTVLAWALGGGLAGLAGILVGTTGNIDANVLGLQVLPAFVAALLGGLESLGGVLAGAAIVGLVTAEIPAVALLPGLGFLGTTSGVQQLIFMVLAFVILATRGQRLVGGQVRDAGLSAVSAVRRVRARPQRNGRDAGRRGRTSLMLAAAILVVIFPFLPLPYSLTGDAILGLYYVLAALSIVLLTGWVGQISLAQAELIGVGGFVTAVVSGRWHIPFPLSLLFAVAASMGVAAALGAVALRVRGLYLAIGTLIFAWMADKYLFQQSWMGNVGGSAQIKAPSIGDPGAIPYFDFTSPKLDYLLVLAAAIWAVYTLANVAQSKTGRAFFALRGSEVAAASLGIDVARYKLIAFAAAGGLAGLAGCLYGIYTGGVTPDRFDIRFSLFILGIAVVGGIESLGGAVLAGLLFAALAEVFFRVDALAGFLDIVSTGLLLFVLVVYPGGLAALGTPLANLWDRVEPRLAALAAAGLAAVEPRLRAVGGRLSVGAARRAAPAPGVASEAAGASGETGAATARRPSLLASARRFLLRAGPPPPGRPPAEPRADTMSRLGVVPPTAPGRAAAPGSSVPEAVPLRTAAGAAEEHGLATAAASNGVHGPGPHSDEVPSSLRSLRLRVVRPEVRTERVDEPPVLRADDVTVQFGGLTAVGEASLEVRRGEIVGLIGPNGAGKTTLFNVISGLVTPTHGSVTLLGTEATTLDVHERARLGVGRTFQAIQLFGQLSVFDNLLVATHMRNRSSLLGHCIALPRAIATEVTMRARVQRVVDFLELGDVAGRTVADLPFGVLRVVEVARALVTGAELVLLDEPASGLDNTESAHFVDLLLHVRDEMGLSMLLIEHDIATVTGVSDYMYVLQSGRIIAHGLPQAVQRDPAVIEAYLGEPVVAADESVTTRMH